VDDIAKYDKIAIRVAERPLVWSATWSDSAAHRWMGFRFGGARLDHAEPSRHIQG